MKAKQASFIQAAVPAHRGPAVHIERMDDSAFTIFDNKGKVKEIHTPQSTLQRIHEVLHARHTNPRAYPGIRHCVNEIIEDCRLHANHWPFYPTPTAIRNDVKAQIADERKIQNNPKATPFAKFATELRATAVMQAMGLNIRVKDRNTERFIRDLLEDLGSGRHYTAAKKLETAFFGGPEEQEKPPPEKDGELVPDPEGEEELTEHEQEELDVYEAGLSKMETVELELTESCLDNPMDGYRIATTGARLYRPALRRPVLPQRLFVKQTPLEPMGAILFDASGSMHVDRERLLDCCKRAPTASVAFYSGDDSERGTLYIFAKDGMRANDIPEVEGGNTVDGQAMDWLMAQDGPHIFVTDRGFCGSSDSDAQRIRLDALEQLGEIEVCESYDKFTQKYPLATDTM